MLFGLFARLRAARERKRAAAARLLYVFHDGTHERKVDPFRTWRALQSDPNFDVVTHGPLMDKGLEPETTNGLLAICNAFGVKLFDEATGTGMTDLELMNLLADFCVWLEAVKKKSFPSPNSSAPMAGESSTSPEPQSARTSFSSDSGSAETVLSAAAASSK